MSYLWQEFNIKTFIAETLVFRDGVFCKELSDYQSAVFKNNTILINKTSKIPIHIIYIGEIAGNINLNIENYAENNKIIITNKIINKKPVIFNIFVKNAGKNSILDGKIIVKNHDSLKINIIGQHLAENTGIFIKTRIAAYKNSETVLEGITKIEKNLLETDSDISFSVLVDDTAKITMKPIQYIQSIPKNAAHSASVYHPKKEHIIYLRNSGLGEQEIKKVLEEAFLEE